MTCWTSTTPNTQMNKVYQKLIPLQNQQQTNYIYNTSKPPNQQSNCPQRTNIFHHCLSQQETSNASQGGNFNALL